MRGRIRELDGLRGCAIAAVIGSHYVWLQIGTPAHGSVWWYVSRPLSVAWAGVDLFFVLSGFLIGGILADQRRAENYFRVFYVRRACRILPIYALLLLSFVALIAMGLGPRFPWLFDGAIPLWSYGTFTQNVMMAQRGSGGSQFLAATWSLAVEEQFYLVFPLVVYFLPPRRLLPLSAVVICVAPLLRLALPGYVNCLLMPTRADALCTGVLVSQLVRSPAAMAFLKKHLRLMYLAFFALLVSAALLVLRDTIFARLSFTRLALFFGFLLLIPLVDPDGGVARLLRQSWLVGLGWISYGVYLFHHPISGLVHGLAHGGPPSLSAPYGPLLTLAALALTVAISILSFCTIERWFLAWGHRFHYRDSAARAGQPAGRMRQPYFWTRRRPPPAPPAGRPQWFSTGIFNPRER